ncbi:MAG: hypothetical protein IJD97_09160 [Clostridia bacterium]|nr:hypothetical protein [Clostridia bacterium]
MKKIAVLLMTAIIIFALTVGASAVGGAVSVTDAEGYGGKTVKLDVVVSENPGSIASVMTVKYDTEALTLTRVEDAGKMGENKHSDNLSADEYYLSWFNPLAEENYSFNGIVVTLSFQIAEDAELRDYDVVIDVKEAYDTDLNSVTYTETAGTITVVEAPPYIPGDVNGDGEVTRGDLLRLAKHFSGFADEIDEAASDVNGDGEVTRADLLRLAKYFSGFDVELGA